MLGAPCSPCCGPGCSSDTLRALYDRLRSSSCTISLSGNLPRQDAGTEFSIAFGATHSSPVSSVPGTWRQWDAWACPPSLNLALVASSFQQDSPPGVHSAWIRYRGATQPDTPLETDRLWIQSDIYLHGLPSADASPPPVEWGTWSLLPGSASCWARSSATVIARISSYVDSRGVLSPNIVDLGAVLPVGASTRNVYAWNIASPFYSANTSSIRVPITIGSNFSPGTSIGRSFWNHARTLDVNEKTGLAFVGRVVDGADSGVIYADNAQVAMTESAFVIPMTLFRRGASNYTPESAFHTWQQNNAPLASSQWVSSPRSPQLTYVNNAPVVEWTRDAASQKYEPTDFGDNWLSLATLTLSPS